MQQLMMLWNALDLRRRATLIGAAAALGTILVFLAKLASAPQFVLLYSGLDAAAAGDVITALDARNVAYEVRGDSIHVPEAERDALRMSLAGEGLPANGVSGYELLDSLSGFGTTAQMFDAAYWRAKEGELARTISASPHIRSARVHLAAPGNDPFSPSRDPSASVSIQPVSGSIGASHAQALRHLVASAVPGLLPANVTIMDAASGRVVSGDDGLSPTGDAAGLSESLQRNVERLLLARVGPGNAVVEVSVELETAHETLVERVIDPESRVVIGTESEETSNSSRDTASNAVTVASNLPEGDAGGGESGSSAQNSETRERVTYDISETQREVESGPGRIRRITVAVLVNAVETVGADGIVTQAPRDVEELEALQSLVQSAVGFDAARGDVVTIDSMSFELQPENIADLPTNGFLARLNLMGLLQSALLAGVALAIAFGVIRPALTKAPESVLAAGSNALPSAAGDEAVAPAPPTISVPPPPDLTPPELSSPAPATAGLPQIGFAGGAGPDIAQFDPSFLEDDAADPVEKLRQLIEEREEETIEILRSWMQDEEEVT